VRSFSTHYSDKDVGAHNDREAELIERIADTPADSLLALAIKTYLLGLRGPRGLGD
jgi:hypothetical protein